MARITEKHRRYRTKEQIVSDLAHVLAAPLSYGTKFAVVNEVTWVWTEFDGKIKGCKYWTPKAIGLYESDRKVKLVHEHVVPKKVVIDMLMQLDPPTPNAIRDICERFLIGVIVTLEEDAILNQFRSTMPSEFYDSASPDYHNPWLRYNRCGIEAKLLCDVGSDSK